MPSQTQVRKQEAQQEGKPDARAASKEGGSSLRLQNENDALRGQIERMRIERMRASLDSPLREEAGEAERLRADNVRLEKETENAKLVSDKKELQLKTTTMILAEKDGEIHTLKQQILRLNDELHQRETEKANIASEKDKLEAYTKKTLIKFHEKYLLVLEEYKAKLAEKRAQIEALEQQIEQKERTHNTDEKLVPSMIYELGLAIMHKKLTGRD